MLESIIYSKGRYCLIIILWYLFFMCVLYYDVKCFFYGVVLVYCIFRIEWGVIGMNINF